MIGGVRMVAEIRERDGLRLVVDPVSLAALDSARRDGGRPAEFGALPDPAELPLIVTVMEYRIAAIERHLGIVNDP